MLSDSYIPSYKWRVIQYGNHVCFGITKDEEYLIFGIYARKLPFKNKGQSHDSKNVALSQKKLRNLFVRTDMLMFDEKNVEYGWKKKGVKCCSLSEEEYKEAEEVLLSKSHGEIPVNEETYNKLLSIAPKKGCCRKIEGRSYNFIVNNCVQESAYQAQQLGLEKEFQYLMQMICKSDAFEYDSFGKIYSIYQAYGFCDTALITFYRLMEKSTDLIIFIAPDMSSSIKMYFQQKQQDIIHGNAISIDLECTYFNGQFL